MLGKKDINDNELLAAIDQASYSNAPAAIRDAESRFLYINQAGYKLHNFHKKFNAEGLRYHEMPASWAEYGDSYEQQDRLTAKNRDTILVLSVHEMGAEKKMTNSLTMTYPIFNRQQGHVMGIECKVLLVNATLLNRFFITERPAVLNLTPPLKIFTKRELEVIFFTLQGLSAKAIAHRMDLSYRTIENKLQIMYRKIDVTNLLQLREYGRAWGFQNYIPPRLVQAGVTFL